MNARIDNRTHKIWRFDLYSPNISIEDLESWKRSKIFHHFKKKLIDKFAPHTYEELLKKYGIVGKETYQKPWMTDAGDIGIDLLKEKKKIITRDVWDYIYIAIPYTEQEMIKFVNRSIKRMKFVTEKKKLP